MHEVCCSAQWLFYSTCVSAQVVSEKSLLVDGKERMVADTLRYHLSTEFAVSTQVHQNSRSRFPEFLIILHPNLIELMGR